MKRKHVVLVKKAVAIGAILLLIALFSALKQNKDVAEYFFARGLSRAWVFVFGHLNDWFGFSLFGVLAIVAVLAILGCVAWGIVLWTKHERTQAVSVAMSVVAGILGVVCIYCGTASGCYNRYDVPLPMYQGEQLSKEETYDLATVLLDDLNAITASMTYRDGKSVSPYTFDELCDVLIDEYKRLDDAYYSSYTPRVKEAIFSKLLSYNGIAGITFQPTGEAAVNAETPDCYKVLACAHELAHAKGVMRERDANLIAYYLLVTSGRPYLRYCGYMYALGYLTGLLAVYDADLYQQVLNAYPEEMKVDRKKEWDFWDGKEGILERINDRINDWYLKLSGVKEGTANYGDPSKYSTEVKQDDEEKPVVVITINYSSAARILIQAAMDRREATV